MEAYSGSVAQGDPLHDRLKEEKDIDSLFTGGKTTALQNTISGLDDFELIAFLVVQPERLMAVRLPESKPRSTGSSRRRRSTRTPEPSSASRNSSSLRSTRSSGNTNFAGNNQSAAHEGVTEIQVFEIALKTPELDDAVLRIDRAIPFPIIFELTSRRAQANAAAYKRPSEADSEMGRRSELCRRSRNRWIPRQPLPVALDLGGLYEQIVRRLIPQPPRERREPRGHVDRNRGDEAKKRDREQWKRGSTAKSNSTAKSS